jgi:hypothetical protein
MDKAIYVLKKDNFEKFIIEKTKTITIFSIFNNQCMIASEILDTTDILFFHAETLDRKVSNVIIDVERRLDFDMATEFNLTESYMLKGIEFPNKNQINNCNKEEFLMFENYKITNIEFGEINPVALETAIEELSADLEGVSLKEKDGKTYIVKEGTAIELDSEEFQSQVQKYVIDKTMSELKKSPAMYKLITKLGIIKTVALTKVEDNLAAIFG